MFVDVYFRNYVLEIDLPSDAYYIDVITAYLPTVILYINKTHIHNIFKLPKN